MEDKHDEARRWVRRKAMFYRIVVIYVALSVLWFSIDVLTGIDQLWFYWPVLGAGLLVVLIGISMFGLTRLFGDDWQRRQINKYLERRG